MKEIWIGLIELAPLTPDAFEGMAGAYVTMLSPARDQNDFRRRVERAAATELDARVVGVEDAEPLRQRAKGRSLTETLKRLADRAKDTDEPAFETIHLFPEQDEES